MLTPIPDDWARRELRPDQQLVDAGYLAAAGLATSRTQFGVDVVGPTRGDQRWPAHDQESFDRSPFVIDWPAHQVTCPEGRTSAGWTPAYDRRPRVPRAVLPVQFARADCRPCPSRARRPQQPQRTLTRHPQEHEAALRAAREREQSAAFATAYALRAGVESTHAQGLRVGGVRRSRSVGQPKTQLQHVLTAVALNLVRIGAWLAGTPLAPTRQSPFARLMTQAA